MAIFTAIASFLLAGTFLAGTIAVPILAGALGLAASIGLSYVARALGDHPSPTAATSFGVQGTIQASGDVPRSFNIGFSVTAGSLVYVNTWGNAYIDPTGGGSPVHTPNAYLTQVIALSDLPGGTLAEIWVNGEKCTIDLSGTGYATDSQTLLQEAIAAASAAGISFFSGQFTQFIADYITSRGGVAGGADKGYPVLEYRRNGSDHLWVKFYDGTQTAADPLLVNNVSSAERPYASTRIGTGVSYVVCTALTDDTLFTGFPSFKFALSGVSLYDPSKDSTNGGSGSHRYSDPSTWGGDGDSLPAVQAYNILRGIRYNGQWVYGLQNMTAARLPTANWITQIAKCRATITGTSGPEPTYRSGGQINVNTQPANALETFLTACQGRLSEIGGFYKIHLGAPDSPTFAFTDGEIVSTEQQVFKPFFALADSVNGVQGTYPDPSQGWNTVTSPAYYRTDLEAKDGNRRLMANPSFDFVPYAAQVQRLQKSAIQEAQRARTHTLVLPPAFWAIEPGDVGSWTSERNGYDGKLFRVDGVVDQANLDVGASLTEVDPDDYNWDHAIDFQPVTSGTTIFPRPTPQGIVAWFAEAATIFDADGIGRRPAIRLGWDGTLPGIVGVTFEVRLKEDQSEVTKGNTDQISAGAIIITHSIIPATTYQARGQYIPSAPREMLWSDWIDVTTPDVRFSLLDFDAAVRAQVTAITDGINDKIDSVIQQIASLSANDVATNWLDKKQQRSELAAVAGNANAKITVLEDVVATLDGFAAAQYSVTLNVNGYATGFNLINGGNGISEFVVQADKFQVQLPGFNGNDPYPFFTTGLVGGQPSVGIRGNLFLDGTINATMLNVGTLSAITANLGTVTAGTIRSTSGKMVMDLNAGTLIISD